MTQRRENSRLLLPRYSGEIWSKVINCGYLPAVAVLDLTKSQQKRRSVIILQNLSWPYDL